MLEHVTLMQVYVERRALNATTNFSVVIQNLKFLIIRSLPTRAVPHIIPFISLLIICRQRETLHGYSTKSIWICQLRRHQDNVYQIFQVNGSTALSGTSYTYSPAIATYDYSIYPKGSNVIFSDSLPPSGGYAIVVVAQSGHWAT